MKNKLVFPLFSILLVSLLFSPNAFSEDTVVRVVAHYVWDHNNPYFVDIFIKNGHNVAGYQVKLQFDSKDFNASSEGDIEIDYGDYLPADAFFGKPQIIDDDPTDSLKVILFAATSHTSESNGDGFLARLTFNEGTTGGDGGIILLDGTLLSNRTGETSIPRLKNSETLPGAVRDLVVESVQATPKDANKARHYYNKGEKFLLRATVKNIGNSGTRMQYLKVYGPAPTIMDIDTTKSIGSVDHKQTIKPNGTVDLSSLPIEAPTDTGTYYYKVCVLATNNEAKKNNNCSTIEIEVEPPDLRVTGMRAEPPNVVAGKKFDLTVIVHNLGRKSDKTVLWWYYHGTKKNSSPEVLEVSRIDPLPKIDDSGTIIHPLNRITVTAPEEPGTYYYSACVDSVEGEWKTGNNCSKTFEIVVGKPNLEVQIQAFQGNSSLKGKDISPGTEFKLYVTVTNRGPGKSRRTKLNLYRSVNKVAPGSDEEKTLIGYHNVDPLTENQKSEGFLKIKAPGTVGSYYYHAVADESDTYNNWSFKGIDLTVEKDRVVFGDVNLTLPPNLISDVAFARNRTYFVLNPQFASIEGGNNEDYFHHKCLITLHIADTDQLPSNILANGGTTLPEKFPYLMIPIETPKEKVEAAADQVEMAREQAKAALVDGVFHTIIGFIPGATGTVIGILSTIGNIASEFLQVSELKESLTNELLDQLSSPKIEISDYSGFLSSKTDRDRKKITEDDTNPILFMIPSRLTSIELELNQQFYREDKLIQIRLMPTGKAQGNNWWYNIHIELPDLVDKIFLPKLEPRILITDVLTSVAQAVSTTGINSEQEVDIQQGIKDLCRVFSLKSGTSYSDFTRSVLEGSLFNIFNNLFSLNSTDSVLKVTDLDYSLISGYRLYAGNPKIATYRGTLNLIKIWRDENHSTAAPHAQPMSLADYPPFQRLSPEMQEYLLQLVQEPNFGKTVPAELQPIPMETSLLPNYPNPFNPETWIPYQLANPADVTLTIYDLQGRVVRDLDLGHQRAGMYQNRARAAHWDGRNAQGEPVASGLYFYTLKAGDFTATRKMLIRK